MTYPYCIVHDEPLLEFGYGQKLESPKDGLFLFGPYEESTGRSDLRLGVVGSSRGIGLVKNWLGRISGHIPGKVSEGGEDVAWAPAWPGFEACFGLGLPRDPFAKISISDSSIEREILKSNRADAVRSTVLLFAEAIRQYRRTEEQQPDVWLICLPDIVFRYGRPQVSAPPVAQRTESKVIGRKAAGAFFKEGDLFPETMTDAEIYLFSSNFHHQLKAEMLTDGVALQLMLESTIEDRRLVGENAGRRGLQDEASIAWNFATTLYFKSDARPWVLSEVRPGVCYVGLVFKRDDTPAATGEACCAAQMFLNSGDGVVFRGALGPWYSPKNREFHLDGDAAANLLGSVLDGYKAKHGCFPSELFIHGRQRFSDAEWEGFCRHLPDSTQLTGVRIKQGDEMRLFRPNASTPILRGTTVVQSRDKALLWTRGYVPRLNAYQGFETPKPLSVEITHGDGEIEQVTADVLALTKLNYNACDFASGVPVTLKFADRVGEILMASPRTATAPPLPFRYYI